MEQKEIVECKREHLGMIQNIIIRMNSNSFTLKGISIGILTACFGIYTANSTINNYILLLPIIPIVIMCFLDTYYLQLERKFRYIYDIIATDIQKGTNQIELYKMPIDKYDGNIDKKLGYFNSFCSKSIWMFYTVFILISVCAYICI